jgi:hypothetical protein
LRAPNTEKKKKKKGGFSRFFKVVQRETGEK